ncbi:MAG TPA: hypothetical protein VGM87_21665 [Roseomonas sp.]
MTVAGLRRCLLMLALCGTLPPAALAAEDCAGPLAAAEAYRTAALAATRAARPVSRHWPDCPPLGAGQTEWRDARGIARRAILAPGGDDSAVRIELFRDAAGRPRLAVITGGAVNGARLLHGIVFAPDGARLCEARRVSEPGYTFPDPWPEALLPQGSAAAGRCPWPEGDSR